MSFDQVAIACGGGKVRTGIPIASDEDLERTARVRLPDVR